MKAYSRRLAFCGVFFQHRDPSTYFAFIVGNNAYPSSPLAKCRNDAEDMRDLLVELGYPPDHVVTLLDATKAHLLDMFREFTCRLDGAIGCHVLLFYAGHGTEGAGDNYLLPIDFAGASPSSALLSGPSDHPLRLAMCTPSSCLLLQPVAGVWWP